MPPFKLHTPSSLDEAFEIVNILREQNLDYDWVAGGTDLIPNYKWHINTKSNVISLSKIEELHKISKNHIDTVYSKNPLEDILVEKASVLI